MSKPDYCDEAGAKRLKIQIENYWLAQGKRVNVELVYRPFMSKMRSTRMDIRSDMLNGMPNLRAARLMQKGEV